MINLASMGANFYTENSAPKIKKNQNILILNNDIKNIWTQIISNLKESNQINKGSSKIAFKTTLEVGKLNKISKHPNYYLNSNTLKPVAVLAVHNQSKEINEMELEAIHLMQNISCTPKIHAILHANSTYFVQKLASGGDLSDYIGADLSNQTKYKLALELTEIGAELEKAEIVHHDVWLDNFLIHFKGKRKETIQSLRVSTDTPSKTSKHEKNYASIDDLDLEEVKENSNNLLPFSFLNPSPKKQETSKNVTKSFSLLKTQAKKTLSENYQIMITDFTYATQTNLKQKAPKAFHLRVAPPEVFTSNVEKKDKAWHSPKYDSWSMGLALLHVFANIHPKKLPWTSQMSEKKKLELKNEAIHNQNLFKDVPNEVVPIIKDLLEPDPLKRISLSEAHSRFSKVHRRQGHISRQGKSQLRK